MRTLGTSFVPVINLFYVGSRLRRLQLAFVAEGSADRNEGHVATSNPGASFDSSPTSFSRPIQRERGNPLCGSHGSKPCE